MSPVGRVAALLALGFPRVSGDEPPGAPRVGDQREFSPREWG